MSMADFAPGEIKIEGRVMDHAHGAWAGMRPQWFTATHIPTGFAVTWHEHCHSGMSQHRQREAALACLRLMIDEMRPAELPMVHPNEQGKERTG
ncbi:peptide chain release factor family protein [Salipiger abyssi]|nr:hypothetical protein [Salipiger abyssi]